MIFRRVERALPSSLFAGLGRVVAMTFREVRLRACSRVTGYLEINRYERITSCLPTNRTLEQIGHLDYLQFML